MKDDLIDKTIMTHDYHRLFFWLLSNIFFWKRAIPSNDPCSSDFTSSFQTRFPVLADNFGIWNSGRHSESPILKQWNSFCLLATSHKEVLIETTPCCSLPYLSISSDQFAKSGMSENLMPFFRNFCLLSWLNSFMPPRAGAQVRIMATWLTGKSIGFDNR